MVRSKTILSLACAPLVLGLGACGLDDSQTDSQVVLDRGGDTDEEGLHLHDVGDAPTPTKRGSTPPKRGSTETDSKTLIGTDAEISPINPNRPGPKKGEPGKFAYCGDGQLQTFLGEECDDGNTINGDGCSKQCTLEKNSGPTKFPGGVLQPIKPLPIKPIIPGNPIDPGNGITVDPIGSGIGKLPICGNGIFQPPEEMCDDGNTIDGDGCSSDCQIETFGGGSLGYGLTCLGPDEQPTTSLTSSCSELQNTYADVGWVGVLDSNQYPSCEAFELDNQANNLLTGFTVSSLFPELVGGAGRPAVLTPYCLINPIVSTGTCDDPTADFAQYFFDSVLNIPVVGAQLPDVAIDEIRLPTRDVFHEAAGVTNADAAFGGSAAAVRVAVLDTAPNDWSVGLDAADLNSGHGPGMETIIRRLTCGDPASPDPACTREVENRLALPRVRDVSSSTYLAERDDVFGGHMGTIADVAISIDETLRTAREQAVVDGAPDYLVMNMSLGWDGAAWGDLPAATKGDSALLIDAATNSTSTVGVDASVRAALAASLIASCEGAMMMAAVGNGNKFTCDGGPLVPAAWEAIPRLSYDECLSSGLSLPDYSNFDAADWSDNFGQLDGGGQEPVYEPLVFGVSATNYDGETLGMQRSDATARLSAIGFRSVDEDLNGDWTEIQSGTSIATAVVSASMANAWAGLAGTDPDISAAAVVDAVYAASPVMVEDATYATSGIPNGACDALAYLSGSPAPYTPSNDNVAANFEIGYPEGYIPSAKAALSHVITGCSAVAAVTGTIPTGCIGEASLQAQCDAEAGFDAAAVEVESSTEPGVGIDDADEGSDFPGLVPPLLTGTAFISTGSGSGSPSFIGGCSESLPSASGSSCSLVFDYIDGDGPITTTTGELPTNYVLPQPKTSGCPACEIVTGGPKVRLNTSRTIAPLAPHHVVVTRMGRGKNPSCSPLVIDLGDLTLSSTRILEVTSAAFGPDACRVKAEVDITYTDAAGASITVTESIPTR